MKVVILGLSVTSSWGNGHATTYRSLIRGLHQRGHEVIFLERDVPWYAANRDLPEPPYCRTVLYGSFDELRQQRAAVRDADLVVVGSYVPEGAAVGHWVCNTARGVTAFYDIDTPVTLAKLARGDYEYLTPELIPRYELYFSFTGGPTLRRLETQWGARNARVLYCSVDPELYYPEPEARAEWDLGYLGTYSADRQPALERLLLEPARRWAEGRFMVMGPLYPEGIEWPKNVARREHLAPAEHRGFYNAQRFTLNITRADMVAAGWSPSVRLFEAAACGTAIVSDRWEGLETVFEVGREIQVAESTEEALVVLRGMSEAERRCLAERARARVLGSHTGYYRAAELEGYARSVYAGAGCASVSPSA